MLVKISDDYTVSITKTDPHRHKYLDAMAEYLDREVNMFSDEWSGNVECPTGAFARFGKRILFNDERGFVWVEKWPSDRAAAQVFAALELYYYTWDDEEITDEVTRTQMLANRDAYLKMVAERALVNVEAPEFDDWIEGWLTR